MRTKSRIKKWYCPQCQTFKSFAKKSRDYTNPFDMYGLTVYRCRCCGHKLIDVKGTLRCRDILYVIKAAEEDTD